MYGPVDRELGLSHPVRGEGPFGSKPRTGHRAWATRLRHRRGSTVTTTLHVYDFTQGDKDQKGTAEREGRHHQLSERRRMTLPETGGRLRCPSPLQRPIRPYLVAVTRQRRNHRSSVWREQRTAVTE